MLKITLIALSFAGLMVAGASSAATIPANRYWTPAQANAAVIAQATRPYCVYFPADAAKCANGKPIPGVVVNPVVTRFSDCVGVAAKSKGGRFSEFRCRVTSNNEVAPGTLDVFTASATKIRWKRTA